MILKNLSRNIPDAPMGWPKAIAPPDTFTFDGSISRPRTTAIDCDAKASFSSYKSTSEVDHPAIDNFKC